MRMPLLAHVSTLATAVFLVASSSQAAPEFATDHVLVKLHPGAIARTAQTSRLTLGDVSSSRFRATLSRAGAVTLEPVFPNFRPEDVNSTNQLGERITLEDLSVYYVVRLAPQVEVRHAIQALAEAPEVEAAEADGIYRAIGVPNDPLFPNQWGLNNTGSTSCGFTPTAGTDINAPEAWDIWTGNSPGTKVGILDTGIQDDHEDLVGHVELGPAPALDDNGHGTAVAGIVGATGNNGIGVSGVCQGVTLVSLKCLYADGTGTDLSIAQKVDAARTMGLPIANMSFAGGAVPSATLKNAIVNAYRAGMFLVAGMGNINGTIQLYPAAMAREVFAVGAVINGVRWQDPVVPPCTDETLGSTTGNWIDAAAPGGRAIVTTRWSGLGSPYYGCAPCSGNEFGGTSAATPVVSGVGALLKSRYPLLTGDDIAQVIRLTCQDILAPGFDIESGAGLVKADAALGYLAIPKLLFQGQVTSMNQISSTTANMNLNGIPNLNPGVYRVKRYFLQKALTFGKDYISTPTTWIRNSATRGTAISNPYDAGYGAITAGTLNANGCTLETYVFDIMTTGGSHIMWWPCTLAEATVAMSAIGAGNPPAPVDVSAQGGCNLITVSWIDSGNDGTTGQASSYEVRRSEAPITEANYASAAFVAGGAPGPSGTPETFVDQVGQCSPTLYYAVRLTDSVGGVSLLGAVGSAHTLCPQQHPCDDGSATLPRTEAAPTTLTLVGGRPGVVRDALDLSFRLPTWAAERGVRVSLTDVGGRQVRQMRVPADVSGGAATTWDLRDDSGSRVPAGVYFMRAECGQMYLTHRFIVLR